MHTFNGLQRSTMSKKFERAQRFGIACNGYRTLRELIQSQPSSDILNMTVIDLLRALSLSETDADVDLDRPLSDTDTRPDNRDHCTCDYDVCICPWLRVLTWQEKAALHAKLDIELNLLAEGVVDFDPRTPEGRDFLRRGWKPAMFEY